jgi:hypothetical protein
MCVVMVTFEAALHACDAKGKRLSESRVLQIFEEKVCQFNVKKLLDVDPDSQWVRLLSLSLYRMTATADCRYILLYQLAQIWYQSDWRRRQVGAESACGVSNTRKQSGFGSETVRR